MPSYTQVNRRIAITTPLGENELLLRAFTGAEAISQLFHFDLDLLSENDSIKFQDVVGKRVTLRIFDVDHEERHWNGFVSRFSQGNHDRKLFSYRAEVVPWLWFLTRTADCRIFQHKTVPDIIKRIFEDLGFKDYEFRLYGTFPERDYCVQYRETDFNFVSRLMEEEGIFYFFKHEENKHILVLANDKAAHDPCPGQPSARYDYRGGAVTYEDVITAWGHQEEFRPSMWSQTDYNFETPSTNLSVKVGKAPYEIYDYPGEYMVRPEGDRLAKIRLQEQTVPGAVIQGTSGCRHFNSGFKFSLTDHYRPDQNDSYVLTAVHHSATQDGDYQVGAGGTTEELAYRNSFECIPFTTLYRPARVTPEPYMQGCQTAVVVGPAGEEIYTDKHGRVKVQFHWDREGKKNENSSCWVRVSHPWAGQGWGAISIPRIGQEVIVDFLEGDPDQPIIVGRVYNAEQTPPFGLPAKAVISGIKSNSTKGGGGFNEISMDDTKGTELINIHAQYDQQKKVEHDERVNVGRNRTESVGNDETITIGHNRTEDVKHDETIKIENDKSELVMRDRTLTVVRDKMETVTRNKSIQVTGNHGEGVGGSMTISVAMALTQVVGANMSQTVGAAMEVTVGGVLAESVGGNKSQTIGNDSSETIGKNKTVEIGKSLTTKIAENEDLQIGKNLTEKIAGQHQETVDKEYILQAKKIQLMAEDEVNIKTGAAQITLKKNGDITIEGKTLTLKGSGDVIIKGSSIKEN